MSLRTKINLVLLAGFFVVLAALSIYPGLIINQFFGNPLIFFPVLIAGIPAVLIAILICVWYMAILIRRGHFRSSLPSIKTIAWFVGIGVVGFLFLYFHLSRYVAFEISESEFNKLLCDVRPSNPSLTVNCRVGVFRVDEIAIDSRGGTFFRTYTGSDGLAPAIWSYGFVYKPNPNGTPFGTTLYELRKVSGDWYEFAVADD